MSDHHDNNHSSETKPVAFTTPFIFACVIIFAILSLVSLGDPCCCKGKCETECKDGAKAGHDEGHGTEKAAEPAKEAEHAH